MKYKVIAWTSYDDGDFPEGTCTVAQFRAIIDEVKARGYDFSGYTHQEFFDCTPVLNTGERMCFSSRAWGRIMAEAHGFFGVYDYSNYRMHYDDEVTPEWEPFDDSLISPIEELCETYEITLADTLIDEISMTGEIVIPDTDAVRYIDIGDTVSVTASDGKRSFTVTGISHGRDRSDDKADIDFISSYELEECVYSQGEWRDEALRLYEKGKRAIKLTVE